MLMPRFSSTLCSHGSRTGLRPLRRFRLSLMGHRYVLELAQISQSCFRDCHSCLAHNRLLRLSTRVALAACLTFISISVRLLNIQFALTLQVAIASHRLLLMVKAPANGAILMLSIKVTWGLLSNGHGHRKPGQSLELATAIILASCNLSVVFTVLLTIALTGF